MGTGISRIKNAMTSAGLAEPIFNSQVFFKVVFKREKNLSDIENVVKESNSKSSEKILKLIVKDKNIAITTIAETIGISTRAVEKQIAKLKENGQIERIGPDKGGYWEVKNN